jgi:hypothetical protein
MEAWLNCENLLITLADKKTSTSVRTRQVLDECAQICLSTLHALRNKVRNHAPLAVLCVGICEECAEVCERYGGTVYQNCASACRQCATAISRVVLSTL